MVRPQAPVEFSVFRVKTAAGGHHIVAAPYRGE